MDEQDFALRPVAWVESSLTDRRQAPNQANESAPEAWLRFSDEFRDGLTGLRTGAHVMILTWFHRSSRDALIVHPHGDPDTPATGVFNTRSPNRPNPIGLHEVEITAIEDGRVCVRHLEALDGTPVIDIKPAIRLL